MSSVYSKYSDGFLTHTVLPAHYPLSIINHQSSIINSPCRHYVPSSKQ
jgi:hypothetical protein